jgi:hypothetical protein
MPTTLCLMILVTINVSAAAPTKEKQPRGKTSASQTPPAPKADVIVEMEQYVVRADHVLPMPESWRYVRVPKMEFTVNERPVTTPEFEILSNLSRKNTESFVIELQRHQFAGIILWPGSAGLTRGARPLLILDNTVFGVNESTKIAWQPIIVDNQEELSLESTVDYNASYERNTSIATGHGIIAIKTAVNSRVPLDMLASQVNQRLFDATFRKHANSIAPWLRLGLARLLASVEVNANEIIFGRRERMVKTAPAGYAASYPFQSASSLLNDQLAGSDRLARMRPMAPGGYGNINITGGGMPMPLGGYRNIPSGGYSGISTRVDIGSLKKLFEGGGGDKDEKRTIDTVLAQEFLRFALYGEQGKYAAAFLRFVDKAGRESVNEEFFKECFGMSYGKMENFMSTTLNGMSVTRTYEMRGKMPPMPPFVVRDATQAEIGRIRGDIFYLENKPARAIEAMRLAYWRGERDPELLAALADLEQRYGSRERCEKILAALSKLPRPPARALVTQVRRASMDTINNLPPNGHLEVADTSRLLSEIIKTMGKVGPNEDLCETFAEVVLRSKGTPGERIVIFLKNLARSFPDNKKISQASRRAS